MLFVAFRSLFVPKIIKILFMHSFVTSKKCKVVSLNFLGHPVKQQVARYQFYVNEWVTRYGAPRVSSRVRLILARNFQRKSYVRPWPIKLSVGNPATFLMTWSRRDLDQLWPSNSFRKRREFQLFPLVSRNSYNTLITIRLQSRFYPSQSRSERYWTALFLTTKTGSRLLTGSQAVARIADRTATQL